MPLNTNKPLINPTKASLAAFHEVVVRGWGGKSFKGHASFRGTI
jgi:hypothetical protein